ncbi:MAG: cation-translocating P-type ATPase [bacterium]|nr:cation-translocating P-type ATPase [bacterium]
MNNIRQLISHYHLSRLFYIFLVISLFLFTFSDLFDHRFKLVVLALALVPVLWEAIRGLKEKKLGSEIFFALATVVALIGDEEQAITVVLIVGMIAGYLERLVEERTEHAIESLVKLIPTDVLVRENGREELKPISEVRPGMQIIVKTGSRIPVDGVIIDGAASINEAALTGESEPKEKKGNELVFAGTFVESGSVIIEAQKIGTNTMFGKIEGLLKEAGSRKAKISILADRVALILTPALILFIGGVWLVTHDLRLVITLLVFGSPIELALVTPLTILGGIVAGFKNGILVKGGLSLERFAHADTIIFDKTGTLTIGEPRVVAIQALDKEHSDKDIIKMAAIAEKRSGHVLSKAILEKAKEENITIPDPDHYISVSGHGVEVDYGNEHYRLGSKHFIEAHGHGNIKVADMPVCADGGLQTSFYLACGNKLCGMICVSDEVRKDAKETIEKLKQAGIKNFILLSGDRTEVVQNVAESLGISQAYGEVMPDQKLKIIEKLQEEGHKVAMVGDGINDAPSLKQADVGIAMGAMGMEPAIEASDIALMSNDLSKIVFTRALSSRALRTIKQNIILGLGFTHGLGMILALLHILNPIQAAFFHAVPDLLILFNSGRLLGFNIKSDKIAL